MLFIMSKANQPPLDEFLQSFAFPMPSVEINGYSALDLISTYLPMVEGMFNRFKDKVSLMSSRVKAVGAGALTNFQSRGHSPDEIRSKILVWIDRAVRAKNGLFALHMKAIEAENFMIRLLDCLQNDEVINIDKEICGLQSPQLFSISNLRSRRRNLLSVEKADLQVVKDVLGFLTWKQNFSDLQVIFTKGYQILDQHLQDLRAELVRLEQYPATDMKMPSIQPAQHRSSATQPNLHVSSDTVQKPPRKKQRAGHFISPPTMKPGHHIDLSGMGMVGLPPLQDPIASRSIYNGVFGGKWYPLDVEIGEYNNPVGNHGYGGIGLSQSLGQSPPPSQLEDFVSVTQDAYDYIQPITGDPLQGTAANFQKLPEFWNQGTHDDSAQIDSAMTISNVLSNTQHDATPARFNQSAYSFGYGSNSAPGFQSSSIFWPPHHTHMPLIPGPSVYGNLVNTQPSQFQEFGQNMLTGRIMASSHSCQDIFAQPSQMAAVNNPSANVEQLFDIQTRDMYTNISKLPIQVPPDAHTDSEPMLEINIDPRLGIGDNFNAQQVRAEGGRVVGPYGESDVSGMERYFGFDGAGSEVRARVPLNLNQPAEANISQDYEIINMATPERLSDITSSAGINHSFGAVPSTEPPSQSYANETLANPIAVWDFSWLRE
ncbi:hypothetical protein TWF730_002974 [Orbilia blumenaviensis]|uniref:Uncharacterized protein n=1 Tax=Orbilia blumenaviensis TaxID=1796055 RepID=A0AAV9U9X1_9PEZI